MSAIYGNNACLRTIAPLGLETSWLHIFSRGSRPWLLTIVPLGLFKFAGLCEYTIGADPVVAGDSDVHFACKYSKQIHCET
jgi:hypothetical protein